MKISAVEILQFMTANSLRLYKAKNSNAPLSKIVQYEKNERKSTYKKGVVFVSESKKDLSEGRGFVVSSYETLHSKVNQLTHWTPNTYCYGTYYDFKNRIIKGSTNDNLKQISVLGFDIDTKEIDLYGIYLGAEELGLPRPNLLIETPKGFQLFYVLETPFYINKNTNYKALNVAEKISDNIKKALKKYVPIDVNCSPFGFFRIPREDNILDFYDIPANTSDLIRWSQRFEAEECSNVPFVVYKKNALAFNLTSSDWYAALLNSKIIAPGYYSASRNNTIFTLALANYASGIDINAAYDELDQFNSNLDNPLSKREFERILKSAYSGKRKGVKRSYVEHLLDLWTDGQAKYSVNTGWYKFKKERNERQRSHYDEWENDIINYLNKHTSPESPFLEASLVNLSKTFNIAVSSLKEVLKRSEVLRKYTVGRGRGAVTKLATRTMLFRAILHRRQMKLKEQQLTFSELLPEQNLIISQLSFPALSDLLKAYEIDILYRSGASPTIKMIS